MAFNVTAFQAGFTFGGARASLFEVNIINPVTSLGDRQVPILCRGAELPSVEQNPLTIKYFGRDVKFAGNKTFPDWTVQFYNDEDFLLRNSLELWSNEINSFQGNVRRSGANSLSYKSDAVVTQFNKGGFPIKTYKLIGIFPVSIGPIALAWDNEAIEEYSVTFSIDYWEPDAAATGFSFSAKLDTGLGTINYTT
jgi:hypothetical protein